MARNLHLLRTQALGHDTRVGILQLFTEDEGRSLASDDLLRDLRATHPERYENTEPGTIFYHRVRLQDAELLPS